MAYKVIHFISSIDLSSGGPARSMPSICLGMKGAGIDCEVRSIVTPNPNVQKLKDNSISVTLIEKPRDIFSVLFSKHLVLGLDLTNTIAHLQNIWDPALHWVANEYKKQGIPYLISPRGMLEPWSLTQKKWKKKLAMSIYQLEDLKNAFCIHTTAASEMEHVRALGIKCPIAVIPNGININDYPEKDYEVKQLGRKRMLFLSRIHPKKGIDLLLKAWSLLPKDLIDKWELVIAGEGDKSYSLDELNEFIKKNFKHIEVTIVGPQYGDDKIKCYHSANLFVLPTYSENFGMVIAEAMCCGVPVITTTGTPWTELRDQELGWYIDLYVENLNKAMLDAMSRTDNELHELGRKSRDQILKEYSIEAVAHKYKELYSWIYGESRIPSFVYV